MMEIALIALVLVNIARERIELRRQGPYYFLMLANFLDIVLIVGQAAIFYLGIAKSTTTAALDFGNYEHYVDIRVLADLVAAERQCIATMMILVWVKLMDPLQAVFQDFFLLVKMITLMIGKLVQSFLPLLGIIYVAWAFSRYVLLGELVSIMKSISTVLATQYPETLGEFTFDDIRSEKLYQMWRYCFAAVFTVLVVVVMLNLLVSLLNDLYEELKVLAKADWCRAQATTIYMNARWHKQRRQHILEQEKDKYRHRLSSDPAWKCLRIPAFARWPWREETGNGGNSKPPERSAGFSENEWPTKHKRGILRAQSLRNLKGKAAALGRHHLGLASRADDVQAAAVLDSISDALNTWDRQSGEAAREGGLSPLPPMEALLTLRSLVRASKDSRGKGDKGSKGGSSNKLSKQVCWILLRRNMLVPLAGIIGADGRGLHAGVAPRALASPAGQTSSLQEPSRGLLRALDVLLAWIAGLERWAAVLMESLTPSGMERRKCWNEARKISIQVARTLVEFPLSHEAADGGFAPSAKRQSAARVGGARSWRCDYQPQARFSTGAAATGRAAQGDDAGAWRPPSSLGEPADSYIGGTRGGGGGRGSEEVLRTMGGGYLTVTALCTLSRAIGPLKANPAVDNSQKPHHFDNQHDNDVFGQFGPAEEVSELLSLLASLFRVGSPSGKRSSGGTAFGSDGNGGSKAGGSARPQPAADSSLPEAVEPMKELPPMLSEVSAALAAGEPAAVRRRRSSVLLPILAQQEPGPRLSGSTLLGRLSRAWGIRGGGGQDEGRAEVGGSGLAPSAANRSTARQVKYAPLQSRQELESNEGSRSSAFFVAPRHSSSSGSKLWTPLTTPSPFPKNNSGKTDGLAPAATRREAAMAASSAFSPNPCAGSLEMTEPRRSLDAGRGDKAESGAVAATRTLAPAGGSHGNGKEAANCALASQQSLDPSPDAFPGDAAGAPIAANAATAKNSNEQAGIDLARTYCGATRRRDVGGGPLRGARGQGGRPAAAAAVESRIPTEAYEASGGSNFAVFLAVRWENTDSYNISNTGMIPSDGGGGGNGDGDGAGPGAGSHRESGFQMLARLALGEARHAIVSSLSYSQPAGLGWSSRRAEQSTDRRRRSRTETRGSWFKIARDVANNNMLKWWATGEDGTRRRSNGLLWESSSTERHGTGLGRANFSSAATDRQQDLLVLITGIIREHFLAQVKSLLEVDSDDPRRRNGKEGNRGSTSTRSFVRHASTTVHSGHRRRSSVIPIFGNPFEESWPCSGLAAKGAALAYLVAIGGGFGDGDAGPCFSSEGPEALIEAGMVTALMRVAATASVPIPDEEGPSARVLALASLATIVAECTIEDDVVNVPVRGFGVESEGVGEKIDEELGGWDCAQGSEGGVIMLSQALDLACLFMDIMVDGLASCDKPGVDGYEGEDLADRSIAAIDLLLRACESHDSELGMAGSDFYGDMGGTHDALVETIRHHRGYPSLEQLAEANHAPDGERPGWGGSRDGQALGQQHRSSPRPRSTSSSTTSWWDRRFRRADNGDKRGTPAAAAPMGSQWLSRRREQSTVDDADVESRARGRLSSSSGGKFPTDEDLGAAWEGGGGANDRRLLRMSRSSVTGGSRIFPRS